MRSLIHSSPDRREGPQELRGPQQHHVGRHLALNTLIAQARPPTGWST